MLEYRFNPRPGVNPAATIDYGEWVNNGDGFQSSAGREPGRDKRLPVVFTRQEVFQSSAGREPGRDAIYGDFGAH